MSNVHALFDKERRRPTREAKISFQAALKTERYYIRQIRKIAEHVSHYIGVMWEYDFKATIELYSLLTRYAQMLVPWATAVTNRMHLEIAARNMIQWDNYMQTLGHELEREVRTAPTGQALRDLLNQQVHLIKSIPTREAQRVHELTMKGLTEGTRFETIRDKILETNDITRARATLIARTEVARTASVLTQVRAEHLGSTGYVWRTARDAIVRPSHRVLEGTVQRWDEPPLCDAPDVHAHPGQVFNCRCHPQPILPEPRI